MNISCWAGVPVLMLMLATFPRTAPAGEARSNAVPESESYRTGDYRAPVPATLAGARVAGAEEAQELLASKSAVFIDVFPRPPKPENLPPATIWRDPVHDTIDGAAWLPNVGYGVLSPSVESYFKHHLARLSKGDRTRPLVFFCERNCWMSWNAAKRALAWGYSNVIWFSEGTNAWLDLGESLVRVEPEK